jgi:hypothetical protein
MFSSNEKKVLAMLVKRDLESFKKGEKAGARDAAVGFLKAEHEYEHFLEALLKKLGK